MLVPLIVLWAATAHRTYLALRDPLTLWRLSYAAALWFVAMGLTFWAYPALLAATDIPNLDDLVVHALTTLGAGAVAVYLLTLTRSQVPQMHLWLIAIVTLVGLVVQAVSWVLAPIHGREIDDLAQVPPNGAVLAHLLTYYALLIALLVATAITCAQLALRAAGRDVMARSGLWSIALGTALAAGVITIFATHVLMSAAHEDVPTTLRVVGDTAAPFAVAGIAAGTVLFVAGVPIQRLWEDRRTAAALRPLHRRLRELHPSIALPPAASLDSTAKSERMRIEVHDALALQTVPDNTLGCPFTAISRAILAGHTSPGKSAASQLPKASTRDRDDRILATLAATYREEARSASHAK